MPTRRTVVAAMVAAPVAALAGTTRREQAPRIVLSKQAFKRIADILERGGKIHTISYSLPSKNGMMAGGISYLVWESERDWRIVK